MQLYARVLHAQRKQSGQTCFSPVAGAVELSSGCFSYPLPPATGQTPSSTPLALNVRVSWHIEHGPQHSQPK